uniref:Uncharacterized protein n=1 Tax=Octopus bimaculoides TaxID=37653 RepID=A0A0L8HP89_OCTBM
MPGICTVLKEDLNTSCTEIMYSIPLTGLGYLEQLRDNMDQLHSTPMSTYGAPKSSVPNGLHKVKFVIIRCDASRKPLHLPYDGPYEVIHPGDKLKPAYLNIDSPVLIAQPPNGGCPEQVTLTPDDKHSSKSQVSTYMDRVVQTPYRF